MSWLCYTRKYSAEGTVSLVTPTGINDPSPPAVQLRLNMLAAPRSVAIFHKENE